jgi:hypothetical protein
MKKHSDESLKAKVDPEPLNIPGKPFVRYVGFGSIEGGRRLRFAVKSNGQKSVEVTIEVSHASFTRRASGISIQDAAPMAYEKIVELLATEDTVESNELCLTDADIARYITRHLSSQKRAYSMNDGKRRSDVAA